MKSEVSLQGSERHESPNSAKFLFKKSSVQKNSNGSAKGHGEVFMTSVCNWDFSLKSTESEGRKRHKLGSMRLSLLIQKFYFTHIENIIVTKIFPIMHFYLMTLVLLLLHSVVHALFDSKWSLLKPVQKMLGTFTLLSRHILEPSSCRKKTL